MYSKEQALQAQSFGRIAGVDEAGRGPLAGPVVAAAVILPTSEVIEGLRDSKKLTESRREKLFDIINQKALVGVGIVEHITIDKINILQAAKKAMQLAVEALNTSPDYVIVDSKNMNLAITIPQESIVKGDATSASIAAASIIAKVTRDKIMFDYDEQFPQYGFRIHKGYPTKKHIEALDQFGPTSIHRKTFGPVAKRLNLVIT